VGASSRIASIIRCVLDMRAEKSLPVSFSAVGLGIGYCAFNKAGSRGMLCCIFRAVSVCVEIVDCKSKLRVQNCYFFFRRLRRAFHFWDFTFSSWGSRKVTTLAGRVVNGPRVHKSHVVNRAKQLRLRFLGPMGRLMSYDSRCSQPRPWLQ
jgi:hypothetical protein